MGILWAREDKNVLNLYSLENNQGPLFRLRRLSGFRHSSEYKLGAKVARKCANKLNLSLFGRG